MLFAQAYIRFLVFNACFNKTKPKLMELCHMQYQSKKKKCNNQLTKISHTQQSPTIFGILDYYISSYIKLV